MSTEAATATASTPLVAAEAEAVAEAMAAADDAESVLTPRVHIANFPMPPVRGDFGSGAVEQMIDGDGVYTAGRAALNLDANGDGFTGNDLLYVPSGPSDP